MSSRPDELNAIRERDPAATSNWEVRLLYNGYKAMKAYRRAHKHYKRGRLFLARWISQRCLRRTGIEIHPAAEIGERLFIDHGTGVVIGETTVIGNDCLIYQGVTLGGTGKDKGKRHPTLGNRVMVGAGAKVLGPITIEDDVRIAAGAVVLTDIPAGSTAVGVPARVVRRGGTKPLDQVHISDPVSQELCRLTAHLNRLQAEVAGLKNEKVEEKPDGAV